MVYALALKLPDSRADLCAVIVDASSEFKLSVGIEAGTTRVAAGVDAAAPSDDQARIADTDDEEASDDQPRKKVTPKEEQPAPAEQEKPKKPVEEKPEKPVEETPKKPVEETATPTRKAVNRLEAVSRPTSTTRMAKCQRKRDVVRRNYEVLERAVQPLEKYLRTRRHQLQKRAGSRTVYIITADHAEVGGAFRVWARLETWHRTCRAAACMARSAHRC
jgi:outer membrane biosynthesis protein TonB